VAGLLRMAHGQAAAPDDAIQLPARPAASAPGRGRGPRRAAPGPRPVGAPALQPAAR